MRRKNIHPIKFDETTDALLEAFKVARIEKALQNLPAMQKRAIEGRHILRLNDEEIACDLDMPLLEARRVTFLAEEGFRNAFTADQAKMLGWTIEKTARTMDAPDRLRRLFSVFDVHIPDLTMERIRTRFCLALEDLQRTKDATERPPPSQPIKEEVKRRASVRVMPLLRNRQPN